MGRIRRIVFLYKKTILQNIIGLGVSVFVIWSSIIFYLSASGSPF